MKRRPSAALGQADPSGELLDRPRVRDVLVQQRQGMADSGVVLGAEPPGGLVLTSGEPGAQRGDEQDVEQSVQQGPLPGRFDLHLVGQHVEKRSSGLLAAEQDHARERRQQGLTGLPFALVGADEQHAVTVRRRVPRCGSRVTTRPTGAGRRPRWCSARRGRPPRPGGVVGSSATV